MSEDDVNEQEAKPQKPAVEIVETPAEDASTQAPDPSGITEERYQAARSLQK